MGCGFSKNDIIDSVTTPLSAVVTGQQQQQQHYDENNNNNHPTSAAAVVSNNNNSNNTTTGISAYYKTLPVGAIKVTVRNVYDGDTLTLIDERRVRFLGIDTPEIKEKQPYSQEAKNYTKSFCDKKEIYIFYEPGHEKEDHYGRLLAWVYVHQPDTGMFLCINEGLVCSGFASVYIPNTAAKFNTIEKMQQQQKVARQNKLGIWNSFTDCIVYTTRNGSAYHKQSCKHLANSKNLITIKASAALDNGLHPCRTCQG